MPKSRSNKADRELAAIHTILDCVSALDAAARGRVFSYVFSRIDMNQQLNFSKENDPKKNKASTTQTSSSQRSPTVFSDIRSLKEEKAPKSNVEMAVLVAYYLSELAPEDQRQDSIGTSELVKYFKQANYKLPTKPRVVLFHAKNSGYLDNAAHGKYKLNPVGYNLVAHKMAPTVGDEKSN